MRKDAKEIHLSCKVERMILFARRVKRIVLRQKLWPNSPWTNALLWLAERTKPSLHKGSALRPAGEFAYNESTALLRG